MSAFSERIVNGMRTAYHYIVGKDDDEKRVAAQTTTAEATSVKPAQKSQAYTTSPISVVNPTGKTTGEVGERYEHNPQVKSESKSSAEAQKKVTEITNELKQYCEKANIDFVQLMLKLSAITGKTLKQFHEINPEVKAELLSYVHESVEKILAKKAEGKIQNVDALEAVTTDAYIMYHFITNDKNGNKIDLETMTPKEVEVRRKSCEKKLQKYRNEQKKKLGKLSESERKLAIKDIKAGMDDMRMHIFETVSKQLPFQSAMEMMLIVASKDVGNAAEKLMESYPPEIREKIASTMQDFDSFLKYVNEAKSRGEKIDTEATRAAFEKYHRIFGSYKNQEAFEQYQQQYVEAREQGVLPQSVMQAAAMGIGEAAYTNHVMTSEQKEAVLQTWVKNNDGYLSDAQMQHVEQTATQYINEYLEKHPEEKEKFNYVTKNIKEIVESTLKREFKPEPQEAARAAEKRKQSGTTEQTSKSSGSVSSNTPSQSVISSSQSDEIVSADKIASLASITDESQNVSQEDKEQAKKDFIAGNITIRQAAKKLGAEETIKLTVTNPNLRAVHKDAIELYIVENRNDKDKMQAMIKYSPDDIKAMIVSHIPEGSEVAAELIERHEISHDAGVILQNQTNLKKDLKNDFA